MSSNGYRQAQLRLQRQQQIQRKKTEKEAIGLLKVCQKKLNSISDPVMAQLLGSQRQAFLSQIERVRPTASISPDSALWTAQGLQQQINDAVSAATVRAEQIQFENLKKQAAASLSDTGSLLKNIHDPAIQQLLGAEIRKLQPQIRKISELIKTDPKKATAQSKALQKQFGKLLDQTQKQLEKQAAQKAQANAELEAIKQQLEAANEDANDSTRTTLQEIQTVIETAQEQYHNKQYKALSESCQQVQAMLKTASRKDFDETVRKEVVNGLLTTLGKMGFVVQPPYLDGDKQDSQTVRLMGKLPSGKQAAFNVHLDGRMDFDFDGYEGRACGKELEKIDEMLNQQFAIELSENKLTWKNPDRIAKGAMQLPASNRKPNFR